MKKIILKYRWITQTILFFHKNFILKRKNVSVGRNVFYSFSSIFEGYNTLYTNADVTNCYLGVGTYISNDSVFKNTKIGRFCSIGPYVRTIFGNHPTSVFVSTHPAFFSPRKQCGLTFTENELFTEFSKPLSKTENYRISIGNDVWIGANAIILDGVSIGDGAIIAAGSLVNKDVDSYTIVGGVPAKLIRPRFSKQKSEALLKIKWWNMKLEDIEKNARYFVDIDHFLKKFERFD